ncbi:MAG: flagellar biosynthetic protein FliO [Myxococcales bacterium]|nr:flagellar biosynthetic protein FliO [Myxococcales bacterium]
MWLPAAELSAPPGGPELSAPSAAALGWSSALWQTALALLCTCALALVVLRLLRPRMRPRNGGVLQLVAQLPLGETQAVYLVRAAGRYLLVGGSGGALALLREMEPAEVEAALAAGATLGSASDGRAPGLWQRLRGRGP